MRLSENNLRIKFQRALSIVAHGELRRVCATRGALSAFTYTLTDSKLEANQLEAGTFSFNGTVGGAEQALQTAGFVYHWIGFDLGSDEYRSAGQPDTGANSGHFIVDRAELPPKAGVPQVGGSMHFGEHNPFAGPEAAWQHLLEQ